MYLLAQREQAKIFEQVKTEEARLLRNATSFGMEGIGHDIHEISDDLALLVQDGHFSRMLADDSPENIAAVAREWVAMSQVKRRRYDQIRWIDEAGMERLRVDNRGEGSILVPEAELQDKSHRYYFTDAMLIEPGAFSVSPLDLNIEHGVVETPRKPMIRVSTRVFSADGESRGIVIINYRAQMLLDHFEQVMLGAQADAWLVNADGYWLKGPGEDLEWGFMFDRPEASLPARYPQSWEKISASDQGQVETQSGLWTYATISPLGLVMETSRELNPWVYHISLPVNDRSIRWKAVLHVPREQWSNLGWPAAQSIYVNGAVLTFFIIVACWVLAYLQVERQRISDKVLSALDAEQAANRAKDAFLANISHEIRTPLNAIMGFNSLLADSCSGADQLRWLERMDQSSKNLLGIIDNVLDLSRIAAGDLELVEERFSVDALLDNMSSMFLDTARDKGLALEVEPFPESTWMIGDQARLHQALFNLVSNAVKFTESGQIRIRAIPQEVTDSDVAIRFEVHDSGSGVEPDVLHRLFQPFRQGDESTTRAFGGAGLGLVITRRLARLMGGDAGAESEPGTGSTFWFSARLKWAPQEPSQPSGEAPQEPSQVIRREFLGRRVLLAEDNELNREVTTMQLNNAGLLVEVAENGAEAVQMNQDQDYLMLIMDVQMPNLSGLEAARRIRSGEVNADVPILALTASAFEEDHQACMDAGMDGFVTKPAAPEVLYRAILDCLHRP